MLVIYLLLQKRVVRGLQVRKELGREMLLVKQGVLIEHFFEELVVVLVGVEGGVCLLLGGGVVERREDVQNLDYLVVFLILHHDRGLLLCWILGGLGTKRAVVEDALGKGTD